MSSTNETRRAAAKWGENPTYQHDVVDSWTACTECGTPIRRNVETGKPGHWRACACPDLLWRLDYKQGWRPVRQPAAAGPPS